MEGWISLHRKIQENWVWDDSIYFKAWIAMLMQVNHQDNKVLIQSELMECKRGQSLLSLESWTKLFGKGWTKERTRHFFNLLKKDSMIFTENMKITTRLTVCNYEKYQNSQHTENTLRTRWEHAENTPTTSNNNDNKDLIRINNENNVFSEKVFLEFNSFLKQEEINRRKVSEERLNILIENLKSIAADDEDYQVAIIRQAIAGNHSDFRPVPGREAKRKYEPFGITYKAPDVNIIQPPSHDEFKEIFKENGIREDVAEKAFTICNDNGWRDQNNISFLDQWKIVVAKKWFTLENKKI